MPEPAGPRLICAVICEKVLQDTDGSISAIRIVDRVVRGPLPAGSPEMPLPPPPGLSLVVMLRADDAPDGMYGLRLRRIGPDGKVLATAEHTIPLTPGHAGLNIVTPVAAPFAKEGVYWFEVAIKAPRSRAYRLLTRSPFEIVFAK